MNYLLYYSIILLCFIFLSLILYIKLKFKFWNIQPVFHVYDFIYYLFPPGIINHQLPEKNKYYNSKNIQVLSFSELSELKIKQFISFIKTNYFQNKQYKNNIFYPEYNNIVPYFKGHNATCFISLYYEEELLYNAKDSTSIENQKLIGAMTTRPIHINIINKGNFDVYYVDYLCVDKQRRKQGIAEQIIQSHEYVQRHSNQNIVVSLFKREGELTGIVPLTIYDSYCFSIVKWKMPAHLDAKYSIVECSKSNIDFLYEFLKVNENQFQLFALPELSNIIELISSGNMYIYFIVDRSITTFNNILCCYFFRKSCTFLEKGEEVLSCIGSINGSGSINDFFIHGFKIIVCKIREKHKDFHYLAIENISHNEIIINNLKLKTKPYIIMPCAYFFYNFAYFTFISKKVFILC